MADKQKRRYLVCYDIANPKRLGRVHRLLRKQAAPVQYSVFLAYLGKADMLTLRQALTDLIEVTEDDVRMYPLPEKTEIVTLGKPLCPEDVLLLKNG